MLKRIVFAVSVCVLAGTAVVRADDDAQVFVLGGQDASGGYLGMGLRDINAERAKDLSLKEERGVEVTRVSEDSPAAKAGLKTGDVILSYNDERVNSAAQFQRLVRETPPDRTVKMTISRKGATQTLTAQTGSRPESGMFHGSRRFEFPRNFEMPNVQIPDMPELFHEGGSSRRLGIRGEGIDGQLATYFGVKRGVLVRSVTAGSAAERAGIRAGDVITKINGEDIESVTDISGALRSGTSKSSATVVLMRDKREMTITVTLDPPTSGKSEPV